MHDKNYYQKHILDDEINNIQRAIKAFWQHPETEIIFDGTINKNRYLKEIKKTEPTKVKINNGTFFVNKKNKQFVFFDIENKVNQYLTGWTCKDDVRGTRG